MPTDRIFADPSARIGDFRFDDKTAFVFDDMLIRSVPGYAEVQRMIREISGDFAVDGTNVYDLGCSTGTTLQNLDSLTQDVRLVGIDSSQPMLTKAEEKFSESPLRHKYALSCQDLDQGVRIENASVVVMALTLQFIRPLYRERLLGEIARGIVADGALILVEKVLAEDSLLNRVYIQHYYEFKQRNGYTEMEISRKREALENVLVPYRLKENEEILRNAGFRSADVFFKWYNFAGIVAVR